jgi:hypothetical protein
MGMRIHLDKIDQNFEPPAIPVRIKDDMFYSITKRLFDNTLLQDENTIKGWFILKNDKDLNTFCFDIWIFLTRSMGKNITLTQLKRKVLLYHVGSILLRSNQNMTLESFNRRLITKTPVTKDEFQELKNNVDIYSLSTYYLM